LSRNLRLNNTDQNKKAQLSPTNPRDVSE